MRKQNAKLGKVNQDDTQAQTLARAVRKANTLGATELYYDGWGHANAVIKNNGSCVVCSSTVYELSNDGSHFYDPDPRGQLGEKRSCACLVADEYDNVQGPDVPMCFDCHNTGNYYRAGLEIARSQYWTRKEGE